MTDTMTHDLHHGAVCDLVHLHGGGRRAAILFVVESLHHTGVSYSWGVILYYVNPNEPTPHNSKTVTKFVSRMDQENTAEVVSVTRIKSGQRLEGNLCQKTGRQRPNVEYFARGIQESKAYIDNAHKISWPWSF